jgi:hypothetical protein
LLNRHDAIHWYETIDETYASRLAAAAETNVNIDREPDVALSDRPKYDPYCRDCHGTKKLGPPEHYCLYLHCLKYEVMVIDAM